MKEEMKRMGGLSKAMFLAGTLVFFLHLCLLGEAGEWLMENMGEIDSCHSPSFGVATVIHCNSQHTLCVP